MTTESKRPRDMSLTVGQAFDRARERFATQADRELAHAREFLAAEAEWHGRIAARVPEKDRDTLARMLENTGAPKVASTISGHIDEDDEDDEDDEEEAEESDEAAELEIRGTTPYVPGPAAQAARGKR